MLRLFNGLKPLIEFPLKHASKFSSYANVPALRLFQYSTNSLCGQRSFSSLTQNRSVIASLAPATSLLQAKEDGRAQQSRSVTKFSMKKGKRKAVKAVTRRFYRLHWGAWIRPHSGRHRKLWKKSGALRRRLIDHVFTNAKQSTLLDIMTTEFWRRPRHWPDDIYEPYNTREEFPLTRAKPHDPDEELIKQRLKRAMRNKK